MRTGYISTTPRAAASAATRRVCTNAGAGETTGWWWKIPLRGSAGAACNVGSDEEITIGAPAQRVAAATGSQAGAVVHGAQRPSILPGRCVPDIELAFAELGLRPRVCPNETLPRTAARHLSALAPLITQRRRSP